MWSTTKPWKNRGKTERIISTITITIQLLKYNIHWQFGEKVRCDRLKYIRVEIP
jgi:hypothetical protein